MVMTEIFKMICRLSMEGILVAALAGLLFALMRLIPVSKKTGFLLWIIIAVRFICPLHIPVDFLPGNLLIQTSEEYSPDAELFAARKQIIYDNYTLEELAEYIKNGDVEFSESYQEISENVESESGVQEWFSEIKVLDVVTGVWLCGMIFFGINGAYSFIRFKKKLQFAMKSSDGTFYEVDTIASPCVTGLFHPKIYLLPDMDDKSKKYALCHERCHIRNHDQIWKLISYLILCLHWFNPFVWFIYFQFQKYLEENCDEQVIRALGSEEKEDYCETILKMAVWERRTVFSAVSLSEEHDQNEIRSRIKRILQYRDAKKSVQMMAVIAFVLFGVVVSLGDNPKAGEAEILSEEERALTEFAELLFEHKNEYIGDAAGNGALLQIMSEVLPDTSYTMQLFTEDVPYGLRVVFEKGPQDLENADDVYLRLYKPAAVLLALIGNADRIMWEYPYDDNYAEDYQKIEEHWALATYRKTSETRAVVQYHKKEDIEEQLAIDDIKEYGESAEKIKELLEIIQWPVEEGESSADDIEAEHMSEKDIYQSWGSVLADASRESSAEKDIYHIDADELARTIEFYKIQGSELPEEQALKYLVRNQALYIEAVENNLVVSDEEVWEYIEQVKTQLENSESDKSYEIILEQFLSEEDYWNSQFESYKKSRSINQYLQKMGTEFAEKEGVEVNSTEFAGLWNAQLESIVSEAIEKHFPGELEKYIVEYEND